MQESPIIRLVKKRNALLQQHIIFLQESLKNEDTGSLPPGNPYKIGDLSKKLEDLDLSVLTPAQKTEYSVLLEKYNVLSRNYVCFSTEFFELQKREREEEFEENECKYRHSKYRYNG
jgi:hypothetical protein